MSRGEERTAVFFLTAMSTGFLTEALTRAASLMRITPSVIISGVLGVVFLIMLMFQLGLAED